MDNNGSNALFCIIGIVVVFIIVFGLMTMFSGEAVHVKDLTVENPTGPYKVKSSIGVEKINNLVKFTISPTKDFNGVTKVSLKNVEITFDSGHTEFHKIKEIKCNKNDFDNSEYLNHDMLKNGKTYCFKFNEIISETKGHTVTHIKADIIFDHVVDGEIVVGHLDNDVTFIEK